MENKKFKNDMKMYELVEEGIVNLNNIPVFLNKWYLNRNTKDKMLFALERTKYV